MLNTSSNGSSGCSGVDRFSKHFEKCCNREGHVKASVFIPLAIMHADENWLAVEDMTTLGEYLQT